MNVFSANLHTEIGTLGHWLITHLKLHFKVAPSLTKKKATMILYHAAKKTPHRLLGEDQITHGHLHCHFLPFHNCVFIFLVLFVFYVYTSPSQAHAIVGVCSKVSFL